MWAAIIAILWSFGGILILFIIGACRVSLIENAEGLEFFNPKIIYNRVRVNWFGAVMLFLLFNALCPIGAFCYWIYKLCTVGRRQDDV